jgi:hypothetical protein
MGASMQEWREIDLRVYPTSWGLRWVAFTRVHRGADRWDRHLDSGSIELGERPSLSDRGAILRAASDALAHCADNERPLTAPTASAPPAKRSGPPGGLRGVPSRGQWVDVPLPEL